MFLSIRCNFVSNILTVYRVIIYRNNHCCSDRITPFRIHLTDIRLYHFRTGYIKCDLTVFPFSRIIAWTRIFKIYIHGVTFDRKHIGLSGMFLHSGTIIIFCTAVRGFL